MIIVSACLAGMNCNYKGKNCENETVAALVREGKAIPVCPEQLGGLTTPRAPAEIKNERIIITKEGTDVTEAFLIGAKEVLKICQKYNCKKAILKANSPSCGCGKIYDGNFNGSLVDGDGITAGLLIEHGIEVIAL
jgi:uncharacterized protein YbbK (DUF523 family)